MSSSLVTKNALAQALKSLLLHYPMNRIQVKMVTETCGVTRHTFYNHFHDVYELLGWLLENEVIIELDEYGNLANWKKGLMIVLQYTQDNKIICTNIFKSLGRDHLEVFLFHIFDEVLQGVIEEITVDVVVDMKFKKEVSHFFAYAITGEFMQWIKSGLKEEMQEISDRIARMLDGTVVRILEENRK